MKQIRLKAMAKINLGLDVVRKREDGYHEVRMIMQTVNLYDKLFISASPEPGIRLKTNLGFLPVNEDNLIYKAAKLLIDEFEIKDGVEIQLQKFIPVAAGMAGGSTDAATTLIGMNKLFDLGLSRRQLMERGVKLGADVPYCVTGGTALSEGIGEILTRLPDVPRGYVLVAKPGVNVSTKFVYGNLKLDQIGKHPDIDAQMEAIRRQDFHEMADLMGNVLETVTIPAHPVIAQIKDLMIKEGAANAMMSGSGPTVFGLYSNHRQAEAACECLRESGLAKMVFLTTFIGQNPYV
ncbi:MAG: 4-(cytidine 5'-diphospho)-2-C-methyl-D-erythritol kinase [Lachnospiraceae bacterium]|nr:4-(cytidine 5'-diphospho)-2-C-methyl-D-erythritol kinase [Lachnospiraceae bacterium]